jgi:hypothetical protein
MRDDGVWISRALNAFAEIANRQKLLASDCAHDSHLLVPVIHRLWIAVAPCGQAVPESSRE